MSSYLGTALAGYAASHPVLRMLSSTHCYWTVHIQKLHAWPPPSIQSAHTRQGCGSLRRRVLSECRVLARLEASPVTGLLGMERNRQGTTVLASRPGFSPPRGCRAWGQACRRATAGVPAWPGAERCISWFVVSRLVCDDTLRRPAACATGLAPYGQIRPWCDTRHSYPLRTPASC